MSSTVKTPGKSFISASALARIYSCAHFWHLQCFGDVDEVVEPDAGAKLRIDAGVDFEKEVVSELKVVQPKYPEDKPWEGVEPTIELMRKGTPLIYQAVLKRGRVFGVADLLEKVKGKSKLGNFTYRPVDVKSHAKVTKKDKLQLAAYSYMLKEALGESPAEGVIVLKDKAWEEVTIDGEIEDIEEAITQALAVESKKLKTLPLRCGECGICPWSDFCDEDRKDKRLVTLLSGVGSELTQKLVDGGVGTYDKLAKVKPEQLVKKFSLKKDRAKDIHLNAKAWTTGKPILRSEVDLPTAKETIVHYDIETYGETLYLHGLVVDKNGTQELKQFVAKDVDGEEKALSDFLEYVGKLRNPIIYTWTTFENGWMRDMAEKYPKHKKGINRALTQFVDLKELVKDALILPVTTFSIKEVAPVFKFKWRADDAGGSNSEAWYDEWLKTGDKGLFQKILHYNEDDVWAMHVIMNELRRIIKKKSA
jgi:uncharacterized protein